MNDSATALSPMSRGVHGRLPWLWLLVSLLALGVVAGCDDAPGEDSVPTALFGGQPSTHGSSMDEPGPSSDPAPMAASSEMPDGSVGAPSILPSAPVDPECQQNGCVRWALFLGDYPRAELQALLDPSIAMDNGYSVWQVGYWTWQHEARATFAIPYGVTPPDQGWPLAVNNPGTVGVGDGCALSQSIGAAGLAGYFGARGFWGITLDYPGLGGAGSHPYLVSEVNGRASLDALRAALNFSARFGIPTSAKAVMAGLSQGGHTTFAAAAMRATYADELDLRAYAVAGPASVAPQHWTPYIEIPGPHLVYHALIAYAWSGYYGHSGAPIWAEGVGEAMDEIMEAHCLVALENPSLEEVLGTDPHGIFAPSYLAAYTAGTFEGYGFLREGFEANQVRPFEQEAPIRLYQGALDEVVPLADTQALVTALEEGGMTMDLVLEPDGHHTDVAFSFLGVSQRATEGAIQWLKAQL